MNSSEFEALNDLGAMVFFVCFLYFGPHGVLFIIFSGVWTYTSSAFLGIQRMFLRRWLGCSGVLNFGHLWTTVDTSLASDTSFLLQHSKPTRQVASVLFALHLFRHSIMSYPNSQMVLVTGRIPNQRPWDWIGDLKYMG